jgi:hypothetical protein
VKYFGKCLAHDRTLELDAQLDGVPEGWGDMSGCLDVVAENFAPVVETDC